MISQSKSRPASHPGSANPFLNRDPLCSTTAEYTIIPSLSRHASHVLLVLSDSGQPEASPLRHLVSVWNPSYAADAMDAHLDVLLAWAERHARKEIEEADVYVWWGKVRSANRLEVLPHRDDVLAIDEQCKAGIETHLYLTDYRSLYVAQVGEITAEDVPADTPDEREHMPAYYKDLNVDFWFRLFDIRRLAANDTVDVIAQLRHLRNTR